MVKLVDCSIMRFLTSFDIHKEAWRPDPIYYRNAAYALAVTAESLCYMPGYRTDADGWRNCPDPDFL